MIDAVQFAVEHPCRALGIYTMLCLVWHFSKAAAQDLYEAMKK
jgi:hypothetical protein